MMKQIDQTKQQRIKTTSPFFRPGTETHERDQLFQLVNGGMGDYINWLAAIKWVAENYDYVRGHVVCPFWFVPVVENVLKDFPKWKAYPDDIPEKFANGYPIKSAPIHPINATMVHLLDLGFLYFAGVNPVPPEARVYPSLDLNLTDLPKSVRDLNYMVMTPGATAPSRTMPAKTFNQIKEYIISIGFTPVFLGNNKEDPRRLKVSFEEDYDFTGGINLLNKTTLLEAAKIMQYSHAVIGIDNGLLHLAAMTSAPIVFGYTIAGPLQRRPARKFQSPIVELYCEPEELPCTFCQERVRFFYDHDFQSCIYGDYECLKKLNAESFNSAIDMILKESGLTVAALSDAKRKLDGNDAKGERQISVGGYKCE